MTKGAIYYTHNVSDPKMLETCRIQIAKGIPESQIICLSSIPVKFGKQNIVINLQGWMDLATKLLKGLEAQEADVIFFLEDDVLYHPSHFELTPPTDDKYYYNTNVWRVRKTDGFALWCDGLRQLSGLFGYKKVLLPHFQKRYKLLKDFYESHDVNEFNAYVRAMGFEPGTHHRPERVDDIPCEDLLSKFPNIDIRHGTNVTGSRWKKEQFRNQKYTRGWKESDVDHISGWENLRELV